jgi:hypothetical protein
MRPRGNREHRPFDTGRAHISLELEATPPVVISLTSHPARCAYLHKTLRGLLKIDYPAVIIDVFITGSVPARVMKLAARDSRLNIRVVERDFGPATKYLYALDNHPDRLIAVCDDDHAYTSRWLRTLVAWNLKLGGEACVACTGMVELKTIHPTDPQLAGALESMGGVTADGVEIYRKVHGDRLRGDPVPLLWPQGYTGYLLPSGLSARLDPKRHYRECLELLPADQLRDMEGRANDDTLMGAYLHRLGTQKVVVPHDNDPRPFKRVTEVESHGALQQRFSARHGMNMGVAAYLALREEGWL